MSLKIRFHFDGRCNVHPRYNPETDGQAQHKHCDGCESLYVIFLYTAIARRKARSGEGLTMRQVARPREESAASAASADESQAEIEPERSEG
jgi:hypothetical protein